MNKILLINPPLFFDGSGAPKSSDSTVPPLGLLYLASYINKYSDKFKAEIIDVGAEGMTLDEIKDRIVEGNFFAIGLSAMTPQLQGVLELARLIKNNKVGNEKVFLGGPHISADPDFLARHPGLFDYAISGEGEITFLDSLNKLLNGVSIPIIQAGEVPKDLDAVPIPDCSLLKSKSYNRVLSTLFSRGCPFQCYYCSRPSISRIVRYRSVENLLQEIKQNYDFCQGKIHFQDDSFTMRKDKIEEFCRKAMEENLRLNWECNTRIDLVDRDLLTLMKKAGCTQINFGIESGNERVRRDIIHKGNFTNQSIKEVFDSCRACGIKIACYFMIGHPTETKEEVWETKRMIFSSKIDVLGVSIPTPFPGSPLYEIARENGIISKKIIDRFAEKKLGEGYSGIYPVYIPPNLTSDFIYGELKEINRKFYVNFKTFWKKLSDDLLSFRKLKADATDLMFLVIKGVSSRRPYIKRINNVSKQRH